MNDAKSISEAEKIATQKYRSELIVADKQSQDSYDRSIITLSGGALGLSLVFIKDIVGEDLILLSWAAILAWMLWAGSIALIVVSFFTSSHALRKAIDQLDSGNIEDNVGGVWSTATATCNTLAGVFLVLGFFSFIFFASANIGEEAMSKKNDGNGPSRIITDTTSSPNEQGPPIVDGYIPIKRECK